MINDYNGYLDRKPRTTGGLGKRLIALIVVLLLIPLVATGGIFLGDIAERTSANYRTDAETEVHKVLGESFIHMGDLVPVNAVPIGQVFYVHTKYIKTETCSAQVSNVFWDLDTHVVHHYSSFLNWFKAGTYEANEMFPIPLYMPEGNYHVIKKTVSTCNGKEHYSVNFDIPVRFYKPKSSR